jgi:nitrogen fixation/metabolism regulation signal transduction histidine kinase
MQNAIAHEIRNHISICDLYAEIIRKNLANESIQNDSIENALNCIKKSLKIMSNSLLDLKAIGDLKAARYDLRTLVTTAIELSRVYSPEIEINYTRQDTTEIYVDENRFLACLVNVLKNAIEADSTAIEVSTRVEDGFAKVVITNNGAPIPADAKIFAEGYTTKKNGSGLGLHICKRNLELQGAELKLLKSDKISTEFEIKILV